MINMLLAFIIILILLVVNYYLFNKNDELKDFNNNLININQTLKISNKEFAKMLAEYDPSLKEYLESKKVK